MGYQTIVFERADGVATVDLSREYESGGGSLSMMMRLARNLLRCAATRPFQNLQRSAKRTPR